MEIIDTLKKKYRFTFEMEVRDYELDTEHIVNNANYLHYMEHTRHKFCEAAGFPFIEMVKRGLIAVVRKIEINYIHPLKSGDNFISCLNLRREGPRFIFDQDIYKSTGEQTAGAQITIVVLKDGKLSRGDELAEAFSSYLN